MRWRRLIFLGPIAAVLVAAPGAHASRLITWEIPSRFVDAAKVQFNGPASRPKALRVNVLLPDEYDGRKRFPVLYLLHGHGDSYDTWSRADRGDVARVARLERVIVVMPEGARGWYTNWWNGGRRGAPAWERYYTEELIGEVERRLRIAPGRGNRAIAGLSMGGGGAALIAAQRPGYFGSLAAFSAPLAIQRPEWPTEFDTQGERHQDVYGDPEAQSFYWAGHNPTALVDNLRSTRVFVAVGNGLPKLPGELDNPVGAIAEAVLYAQARDFVVAARRKGVDVTFRPQDGIHDWPYWRRHLGQAIKWGLFEDAPETAAKWTHKTVAQRGNAWGLRFSFTDPPSELIVFSRNGNLLTAAGSGTVRVRLAGYRSFTAALPFTRSLVRARPAVAGAVAGGS